ncbi:Granule-bound starch synthase 1b, chloroplastic/amyloplastic [Zea mays]|uniref:Granule-bound starch synthase 1b, chloroplastic/amyloplastic n=1 Tax=Zea mays TaxID=4577 RepID=A0A3L6E339_MAIZE|nr:Granule-bound starch synthase 1b, chloroplastic/amyloplastic [Zea mays]PWZ15344.1 Granule-bound starch synthase 1b, chloroplastic/amyloplastic [Zea mays]
MLPFDSFLPSKPSTSDTATDHSSDSDFATTNSNEDTAILGMTGDGAFAISFADRFTASASAALFVEILAILDKLKEEREQQEGKYGEEDVDGSCISEEEDVEDVVFVANDWHTAILPCYLKSMYKSNGIYKNAKVAFCIHNIAYQGRFARADFDLLNLPDSFLPSFDFIDGHVKPVLGRKINWMKTGIIESDLVLTVSPHYVKELTYGPDKGVELDGVLRTKPLEIGIVNGMDVYEWDPSTDKYTSVKYDATTVTEAKALNKERLQAEVGLPVDSSIPVIVFVGRLEEQKGSDILIAAIPEFVGENVQIIVLVCFNLEVISILSHDTVHNLIVAERKKIVLQGTGKKKMEEELMQLEVKYPNIARGIAKFNVPLAHMMFAGSDFIIVPSRFEPCGLIQLQGMRYGVLIRESAKKRMTIYFCRFPSVHHLEDLLTRLRRGVTGFHMGSFNVEGPAKKWEEVLLGLGVEGSQAGIDDAEEIAPLAKENVATP